MTKFAWEGKNRGGGSVAGEMEAPSEAFVLAQLRGEQIVPLKMGKKGAGLESRLPWKGEKKIGGKEMAIFTRQFATMIDAGVPLVQCLDILGLQQENPTFKKGIVKIKETGESGSTFADALSKHPKVFDSLFVNVLP